MSAYIQQFVQLNDLWNSRPSMTQGVGHSCLKMFENYLGADHNGSISPGGYVFLINRFVQQMVQKEI